MHSFRPAGGTGGGLGLTQNRAGVHDQEHDLLHLDPDLQAVLIATAIDGLTTKEAARLLGVAQGTVKTRLFKARKRLEKIMEQAGVDRGWP